MPYLMVLESKYINSGVVKIEREKVKVYRYSNDYTGIYVGKQSAVVSRAAEELNLSMSGEKVRLFRYSMNCTKI